MKESQSTLFISDLHLDKTQPEIEKQFLQFLSTIKPPIDALYILGDLFEAWLGDQTDISQHQNIIRAMKTITESGVPIYFISGNRDFMVGKHFFNAAGVKPLADETRIILYGEPVLLMHGDTLCTRDIAYIKARKILRNPFLQKLFLSFPSIIRKKLADMFRKKSRKHTAMTAHEIMDVTEEEVLRIMQKHNVKTLIHGHTHRPGFHENAGNERIVLGAWHDYPNALVWHKNGEKKLIKL